MDCHSPPVPRFGLPMIPDSNYTILDKLHHGGYFFFRRQQWH